MVKVTKSSITEPQVSSLGRFKSSRGVVSTPKPMKSGYVQVKINGKSHQIHRLIAIAFDLPKRDDQHTVDHIDNDPSNNRKENLKWANGSEQIERSYATNEERVSSAPKRSKPVEGRELGTEAWVPYASSHEAARKLGLYQGSISACCNGRIKKTGNYEFRYGQANEVAVLEGEEWMDVIIESCKKKVVRPNLSVSFASKQVNKNRTDLKNEYCIP